MMDIKKAMQLYELRAYLEEKRAEQAELEERYNPYHDPTNGRFASASGGTNVMGYSGAGGLLMVEKGKRGQGTLIGVSNADLAEDAFMEQFEEWNKNHLTKKQESGKVEPDNKERGAPKEPMSRNYDSEAAQELGKEKYDSVCDTIDSCQNENLSGLLSKEVNKVHVDATADEDHCLYVKSERTIHIDPSKDTGSDVYPENSVFIHETAHALDHDLAAVNVTPYTGNYSLDWENGKFGDTLRREAHDRIMSEGEASLKERGLYDSRRDFAKEAVLQDLKIAKNTGKISEKDYDKTINDPDALGKMIDKRFENEVYKAGAASISKKLTDMRGEPNGDYKVQDVSDLMGLASNNRASDGFGHKDEYARDKNNLPKEAFAEFSAATAANPDSLACIKEFFPESYACYEQMLADASRRQI